MLRCPHKAVNRLCICYGFSLVVEVAPLLVKLVALHCCEPPQRKREHSVSLQTSCEGTGGCHTHYNLGSKCCHCIATANAAITCCHTDSASS
jgi:hypothetical protein